ncbi:tRNA splicing endonuclease subunit sen2 [Gnomoniopsis smithogilvyi]|uniref:tRNA-intron lyase n=1 Tax=Gnomoniopsis smithogilvyi TaxID=1191159 RepID=A0A9W8YQX1_9PEZI|nr:tRNA splicing endonuclease subunit sen2 [Gnomoniopsis smithogilvyi]
MAELQNQLPDQSVTSSAAATTSAEPTTDVSSLTTSTPARPSKPRQPSIHEIYKQPAPLRTFPFPTLTGNPLSLIHLAAAWLSQVFAPPPAEPSVVHTAFWDHETRSISVTDEESMAALWQQGFYGKGNLSRSEPNWLKREKIRQGVAQGKVSEANTDKRREDRIRAKWERARLEQEALEQRRLEESRLLAAAAAAAVVQPSTPASIPMLPPTGPMELLALPNSNVELAAYIRASRSEESLDESGQSVNDTGSSGNDDAESNTTVSSDPAELKRRKSVRFSPKVESTVFQHTDPPSPPRSVSSSSLKAENSLATNGVTALETDSSLSALHASQKAAAEALATVEVTVVNKEHLQLAPEEAFFLVFALGALKVVDTATQAVIPTRDLLTLLRQHSYFPPRMPQTLQPDDPFLVNYVVYHHFRSLGWVPRPGVKFGVDWLLYMRGPVFDHAEYGLLVLPANKRMAWHQLMGVNRVLSKVFKSLVLVYVDVPSSFSLEQREGGFAAVLKEYKLREVMVKRWSSNRNRDVK